jgi:hypothetical protein
MKNDPIDSKINRVIKTEEVLYKSVAGRARKVIGFKQGLILNLNQNILFVQVANKCHIHIYFKLTGYNR